MSTPDPARVPVIIGVGEVVDRPHDPAQAMEPLDLMEQALRNAEADSGASLLTGLDSLDIIAEFSWPYENPAALLAARLGIQPARAVYGEVGGESPMRHIHQAALRIAQGESHIAAVVGGEADYSVAAAKKAGVELPWQPKDDSVSLGPEDLAFLNPVVFAHHGYAPPNVYPLFENATQAHWKQSPAEGLKESGECWSGYAKVASENPNAWLPTAFTAEQIATADDQNRFIAWPYTRSMVANPMVNQGAAVIVTSLARARELGVDEASLVYFVGGARANEPRDYLKRENFHSAPALDAVLDKSVALAGGDNGGVFDFVELYSCFPIVPKMARRRLGLAADATLTVSGGLSFFGAPLNNYMTHAAASMVRAIRGKAGSVGLLYGQGEFLTKHHCLVLSGNPPEQATPEYHELGDEADARRGEIPTIINDYEGPASLETYTVIYGRQNQPALGVVVARTPQGERLMAQVPAQDQASIEILTSLEQNPIGRGGQVFRLTKGVLGWRVAN